MGAPGNPTHYKVSDLKSRFLHLAQTSVYHIKFGTPPLVSRFVNFVGRDVTPGNITDLELLCSEVSLPGSTLATHEVTGDYSGVTEKMAYRRIYDDSLDLTFYVDADYNVIEFFDGWMNFVTGQGAVEASQKTNESFKSNNQSYRMIYPDQYKGNIYLTKYEKDHKRSFRSMIYTFVDAFPTSIVSAPLSYNASEILKFTVSFSYTRYVRERVFTNFAEEDNTPPALRGTLGTQNPQNNVSSDQRVEAIQRSFGEPSQSTIDRFAPRTRNLGITGAGTNSGLG